MHRRSDVGRARLPRGSTDVDKHASDLTACGRRNETEQSELVSFAGFTLDIAGHLLTGPDGREVPLRRSEFALLLAFLRAPGRALSRDHLLDAVAGRQSDPFDRSIDVLVGRLRRKIEADPRAPRLILTVPGMGYKFSERPLTLQARNEQQAQPVVVSPADAPRAQPAERRQLAVMLCGLAGMAALSARLDPEDLRPLIDSYHTCCAQVIAGAGGVAAKFMNDVVLAYFGYPKAAEHDAERAIRAGLAVIEAVPLLDSRLHCRIGLATGVRRPGQPRERPERCAVRTGGSAGPRRAPTDVGRSGCVGDLGRLPPPDPRGIRLQDAAAAAGGGR